MEYIYAALLLHNLGKPVDEAHLHKVITATGAHVDESKIKSLVASLSGVDIASEIANASVMSAAPASGGEAKQEKKEEKKEEGPSESAAGLASLFG